MRALWVVLVVCAFLSPAFGQEDSTDTTVGELRKNCLADRKLDLMDDETLDSGQGDELMEDVMWCYGYTRGYVGALFAHWELSTAGEVASAPAKQMNPVACFETGVTTIQLVAVFMKWADEHPEKWQHSADAGMWVALREAFCD